MSQINVNIRMDEDLKSQFELFCNNIGLNMTSAFNVFAKTVVRQQRIPFELAVEQDPFYSDFNQKILLKSISELEKGEGKTYNDVSEIFADRT